ncbi:mitogen-activated protein kinase kinase 9-like [Triticum dicoccoides]|uniref:mitogen-activated protein kinase kinase 9-like n=1 Tax=Triticum dicoccoides TaxID=85692 RepID=UPI00188F7082|nr:mitogen-activated protein kinase kinase 9-like [Triticum dicoccoides]
MAPGGTMPPCAPHLMFRRPGLAAPAPHAVVPPPAAADMDKEGEERRLRLSDLEWVADLGEGASGVVTKVRLRGGTAGPAFALKVAHYPDDTDAGREQDEVLRRACGAGPPSPYVVRCHAVLRGAGGEPACLLELMDAGSLHDVHRRRGGRGGLPEPALAEVAARCALGLAHLHARGVAHLDLKPDNLLASARGDVKIADFGVSRIFSRDGNQRSTRVSVAVGTTAYMSPERFAPNAQAGPRGACAADVWSLGVTVLELFLGHRPVLPAERTPSWKMFKEAICYGDPPSVPDSAAASAELRGFVAACVQKDPRRRATVPQLLAHPFVARRDVEASRRALREIIVETM